MNTAQSVRINKEQHPERYCSNPRCLWRTAKNGVLNATPCKRHPKFQPNNELPLTDREQLEAEQAIEDRIAFESIRHEDELAEAREMLAEMGERD